MKEYLAITKALSDESRVRALIALAGGELCLCQLIELLALAPSTVSRHMSVLQQAGLVEARKDGRWMYYRLAEAPDNACVPHALAMTRQCLGGDADVRADARRLKHIRKMKRDDLCVRYHKPPRRP